VTEGIRHQFQEQERQCHVGGTSDGLAQREGPVGSQFQEQPLGQLLQRNVIFLIGQVRTDGLTTRGDDGAEARTEVSVSMRRIV
jgi:hypothetical protein